MKHRSLLIVVAVTGLVVLALSGCSTTSNATVWFTGRSLVLRVREIRLTETVSYSVGENHYVMRPSQADRVLAAAFLEIQNREANVVYFEVDKESIRLRDDDFLDYRAIDPFQEREEVPEAEPGENALYPFIWGEVGMPRTCGAQDLPCELSGWVFFEVPRDIKFYQLIWEAGDTIYLRF